MDRRSIIQAMFVSPLAWLLGTASKSKAAENESMRLHLWIFEDQKPLDAGFHYQASVHYRLRGEAGNVAAFIERANGYYRLMDGSRTMKMMSSPRNSAWVAEFSVPLSDATRIQEVEAAIAMFNPTVERA